jgi:glucose/arabinose dehydrogenase
MNTATTTGRPGDPEVRPAAWLLVLFLIAGGCSANAGTIPGATSSATLSPLSSGLVSIGAGLNGPAGLTAAVYAAGAAHVSAFAFDADGRLWFATADYTDTGADAIYIVSSAGAEPTLVVDSLHTPLGLLWFGDALYVSSASGVVAYRGFEGSAFSTAKTIVRFPSGIGEINGIALGADGRMVVGVSAPCNACQTTSEDSAAIVSFLPDGSDLRVDASGIRAPVGLAFYPGTNELLVTMNQRDDLGGATPGDWLAVVSEGQDWGFPDCYGQADAECPGTPSAVAVLDQHAAVSGVAIVTDQLGASIGSAALVAEWAKGTVKAVRLMGDGTIADDAATTLLTGLTNPVPVAVGPDGALYVGNWGSGAIDRIAVA